MYQWNDGTYISHHGILGQKWGVRRYQNPDGSLTQKGKEKIKRKYDRAIKREERLSSFHKMTSENTKERMISVKSQGIENEEVQKRYRELIRPSSDEYDAYEKKAAIERYKMDGQQNINSLFDLFSMDPERAVKTGIYNEYMAELEDEYKSEIEAGRKSMASLERLRSTNVDDIYSSGGYKEAKKKIKSIERG